MKKIITLITFLVVSGMYLRAAVFTSVASGSWTTPSTWTFTGSSPTGIPTLSDNVTITSGFTVTITTTQVFGKNITTNPGGTIDCNNHILNIYGNYTNNGSLLGIALLYFHNTGILSSSTTITNAGNWNFAGNTTIAAGTVISKQNGFSILNGSTLTNNGTASLAASVVLIGTGTYIAGANSALNISTNVTGTGTLNCSATGNTVSYNSNNYTSVFTANATYYNLTLSSTTARTKILSGDLTVLKNLTISTNVTLDWAGNDITLGGHWINFANTTCLNMAIITFNGSGTQNVQRSGGEFFNNVRIAGTGSVRLQNDLTVGGTTTLTSGTLNPNLSAYHQKGPSWLGNGGACNTTVTGKIVFDGGTNQTIGGTAGTTFGNLEINNPGFSVTCTANQTGAGTTTLTAGTFSPGSFIFHQRGASWMANGGTIATGATGEIMFDGSVVQAIDGTVGATFGNLEIASSSTVNLARNLNVLGTFLLLSGTFDVTAAPFAVNLAGNFTHNGGTFTARTGTVTFNGTAAQTIGGSATTTFFNVTSNNTLGGVSVTGIAIITNILQVNTLSFGTSGIGSIILTATGPTTYSKIGPLGVTASLVGSGWTIGAYVDGPATAYWQYLGSPVSNATLADWDNDNRFYMSGVNGNDGNACCPTFFSVRNYVPASATYSNVTSTSVTLVAGKGYMVWMADNLNSLTAPLPYDTKGAPNFGTVLRAVTAGGPGNGYNLVSNPYACPITYASVVAASGNLNANYIILLENGTYTTNPNGGIIAPNQGFMCIATANGNVKFQESAKTTASNPAILRTADPANYLRIASGNATNGLGGETVIQILTDAHNGRDMDFDMPFLASPYDDATNIWTTDKDGEELLLNALDAGTDKLDIPLTVKAGTPGTQLISFKGLNGFSAYSCAWLEDLATGEKINLKEHDTYSFNADAAGEKHNFNLHFERDGKCPLSEQQLNPSLDASSQVFLNNGNILVKFGFEEKSDVVVSVFNVAGQEVCAPKNLTVTNETIALDSPGAHGVYLVRISKGEEVVTKKIYY
jgi:hypothetical protein